MRHLRGVLAGWGLFAAILPLSAQEKPAPAIAARYTKHEYRIPVRDGVRLFTAVYEPKDGAKTYPFLMVRTPYGVAPYGEGAYLTARTLA